MAPIYSTAPIASESDRAHRLASGALVVMRRTEIVSTHVDDPPLRPRLAKAFQRRTNLHLRTLVRPVRHFMHACAPSVPSLRGPCCRYTLGPSRASSWRTRASAAAERRRRDNVPRSRATSLAAEPLHRQALRQAFRWSLAFAQFAGSAGPSCTHSAMPCSKRQMTTSSDQQAALLCRRKPGHALIKEGYTGPPRSAAQTDADSVALAEEPTHAEHSVNYSYCSARGRTSLASTLCVVSTSRAAGSFIRPRPVTLVTLATLQPPMSWLKVA